MLLPYNSHLTNRFRLIYFIIKHKNIRKLHNFLFCIFFLLILILLLNARNYTKKSNLHTVHYPQPASRAANSSFFFFNVDRSWRRKRIRLQGASRSRAQALPQDEEEDIWIRFGYFQVDWWVSSEPISGFALYIWNLRWKSWNVQTSPKFNVPWRELWGVLQKEGWDYMEVIRLVFTF